MELIDTHLALRGQVEACLHLYLSPKLLTQQSLHPKENEFNSWSCTELSNAHKSMYINCDNI